MPEPYGLITVLLLLTAWCVWWLWGVNWHKLWPVLGAGAWAPLVLLMLMATLAWSRLDPSPSAWWQLGIVCGLVALALFCGWLQGHFGWTPPEYSVEPPPPTEHDHGHGHH